jgi:hypothetical protein
VDEVAGDGEPLDEEARQLGLEAGAVGDLVQAGGLALAGGPELVDELGQPVARDGLGRPAEAGEGGERRGKVRGDRAVGGHGASLAGAGRFGEAQESGGAITGI